MWKKVSQTILASLYTLTSGNAQMETTHWKRDFSFCNWSAQPFYNLGWAEDFEAFAGRDNIWCNDVLMIIFLNAWAGWAFIWQRQLDQIEDKDQETFNFCTSLQLSLFLGFDSRVTCHGFEGHGNWICLFQLEFSCGSGICSDSEVCLEIFILVE